MSDANDKSTRPVDAGTSIKRELKPYSPPRLQIYGSVAKLTQSGTGTGADGGLIANMTMVCL